jgi:hypothetical protein
MKSESESVERLGQTKTHATYIEREEVAMLSAEHRSYLLRRHGTLNWIPSQDMATRTHTTGLIGR